MKTEIRRGGKMFSPTVKSYSSQDILEMLGPAETQYTPPDGCQGYKLNESGASVAKQYTRDMGMDSGSFVFEWVYGNQADETTVEYGDGQSFSTGCVSGAGSQLLNFSGSSMVTVTVSPNCLNDTTRPTNWTVMLRCPNQ